MSTVINTNMFSINALTEMNLVERTEERSMERISSGKQINRAADDAAGVALMHKAGAQITGYTQTVRNTTDGITMTQVADRAMGDISNALHRMRELSLQSTSSSFSDQDRENMQVEFSVMQEHIRSVVSDTVFNGIAVLNRPTDQLQQTIDLQVGGNYTNLMQHDAVQSVPVEAAVRGYYAGVGLSQSAGTEVEYTLATGGDRSFEVEVDGVSSGVIELDAETKTTTEWAAAMQEKINTDPAMVANNKSVVVSYDETVNRFTILSDSEKGDSSVKMTGGIFALGLSLTSSSSSGQSEVVSLIGLSESERQITYNVDGHPPATLTFAENVKSAKEWGYFMDDAINGADVTFDAESQRFTIASASGESGTVSLGTRGGIASLGLVVHDTSKMEMNHYDFDDSANALGAILLNSEVISSQQEGAAMLEKLDSAMLFVDQSRAHYGAVGNQLEKVVTYLETARVDSSDVRSRIEDVDFAAESAELARTGILKQMTTAMMAQANQMPEQMLQLFT